MQGFMGWIKRAFSSCGHVHNVRGCGASCTWYNGHSGAHECSNGHTF